MPDHRSLIHQQVNQLGSISDTDWEFFSDRLIREIPLKHLASNLIIIPETLARVRRSISAD
jgi:hypothetical protein